MNAGHLIPIVFVIAAALSVAIGHAAPYDTLGPGVWFLRITNPDDSRHSICVRVYFNPNRSPWYGDVWHVSAAGKTDGAQPPDREQWLRPGQRTDWLDIGPYMSSRPTFHFSPLHLTPVYLGVHSEPERADRIELDAELAQGSPNNVVRRIHVREDNPLVLGYHTWLHGEPKLPTSVLLIPVETQKSTEVWTVEEAAEQQLAWVRACGPLPAPPRKMLFYCHQGGVTFKDPPRVSRLNALITHELGYSSLVDYARDSTDLAAMRELGIEPMRTYRLHRGAEKLEQVQSLRDRGLWDYVGQCNFGDEIDISLSASDEEQNRRFREYLGQRGFDAMDFVRPADEAAAAQLGLDEQWGYVRLQGPLPTEKPRLLYEAAVFRYMLWTDELAAATRAVEARYPPGTYTGANFSPHMNVWPDVRKWINVFKFRGMTMPWSEDWWWQVPEAGPQAQGYLLDALRLAASYHDSPIQYYCITDPGETPEHSIRMNYLAVAHGVKMLNHFCTYNQVWGTCDYIDFTLSEAMFPAIHRVIGDIGQVDEQLHAARVRPAEAAILLSKPNDVWDNEDLLADPAQDKVNSLYHSNFNVDNNERKSIWMALRHAQYPVDLITDDDVIEGRLAPYKALYLVGPEIQAAAAPVIASWVEKGGVLFACGGAGLLDEYRQRLDAMYGLYGLADAELAREQRKVAPRALDAITPLDALQFTGDAAGLPAVAMPALAYRQVYHPASGKQAGASGAAVAGRFRDGSAGAVVRQVGAGHVIVIGTMPGLAYVRPAMGDDGDLPIHYSRPVRELLTAPLRLAGCTPYVFTSEPLVEAQLMESDTHGAIVPLINFSPEAIDQLRVGFPGLEGVKSCRSIRRGRLPVHGAGRGRYVELPLEIADFLVLD
ncbi:MAG: hypothetical protein JSV65_10090 [Armatimonadota bacterium]|nr:MAG: hypothetical protein JSV65_10090 [Armatimonadota bacterium]